MGAAVGKLGGGMQQLDEAAEQELQRQAQVRPGRGMVARGMLLSWPAATDSCSCIIIPSKYYTGLLWPVSCTSFRQAPTD
jgi:hypothetical protein